MKTFFPQFENNPKAAYAATIALVVALVCAGGIYALIKLAPPPPVVEEDY